MVPTMFPEESRNSPVKRCARKPERHRNLWVRSQISGWFWRIQLERQYRVAYSSKPQSRAALRAGTASEGMTPAVLALRWSSQTIAGRSGVPSRSTLT